MSVDAIAAAGSGELTSAASVRGEAPPAFSERLFAEFDQVAGKLNAAAGDLQDLAAGRQDNLHHVMLSLEEAKLSFQLLVQVRNKMLEAYQDLMRMQI